MGDFQMTFTHNSSNHSKFTKKKRKRKTNELESVFSNGAKSLYSGSAENEELRESKKKNRKKEHEGSISKIPTETSQILQNHEGAIEKRTKVKKSKGEAQVVPKDFVIQNALCEEIAVGHNSARVGDRNEKVLEDVAEQIILSERTKLDHSRTQEKEAKEQTVTGNRRKERTEKDKKRNRMKETSEHKSSPGQQVEHSGKVKRAKTKLTPGSKQSPGVQVISSNILTMNDAEQQTQKENTEGTVMLLKGNKKGSLKGTAVSMSNGNIRKVKKVKKEKEKVEHRETLSPQQAVNEVASQEQVRLLVETAPSEQTIQHELAADSGKVEGKSLPRQSKAGPIRKAAKSKPPQQYGYKKRRILDEASLPEVTLTEEKRDWKDDNKPGFIGGAFSLEEDMLLLAAIRSYIQSRGWSQEEGEKKMLNILKNRDADGAWRIIGQVMPYRKLLHISVRGRKILNRPQAGRDWTKAEEELLCSLHQKYGNKWSLMTEELKRPAYQIKDKWRDFNGKTGKWTLEEIEKLATLVQRELQNKAIQPHSNSDSKSFKERLVRDDLPWVSKIVPEMGGRSRMNCISLWYKKLAPSMVADGEWGPDDDRNLLEKLIELNLEDEEGIPWDNILPHREGRYCKRRWAQMKKHLPSGFWDFEKLLELACHRHAPSLLPARGDAKSLEAALNH